jgi:hypothetical protein
MRTPYASRWHCSKGTIIRVAQVRDTYLFHQQIQTFHCHSAGSAYQYLIRIAEAGVSEAMASEKQLQKALEHHRR